MKHYLIVIMVLISSFALSQSDSKIIHSMYVIVSSTINGETTHKFVNIKPNGETIVNRKKLLFKFSQDQLSGFITDFLASDKVAFRKENNNPPSEDMAPDEGKQSVTVTLTLKSDFEKSKSFHSAKYQESYFQINQGTYTWAFLELLTPAHRKAIISYLKE